MMDNRFKVKKHRVMILETVIKDVNGKRITLLNKIFTDICL